MSSPLLRLPEDLLIAILIYLNVEDLISIQQACRALHVFCAADYIWHNIKTDLALNLPHGASINSLPGAELRKLCVAGLRVDHNWRKNPADLKALNRIEHGGIVNQMQYLPPKWLVTMSRLSTSLGVTCILSVWDSDIPTNAQRVIHISLDTHILPNFSAALSEDGLHVFVVMYGNVSRTEILRTYSIPLQHGSDFNDHHHKSFLSSRITTDKVPGSVFEVQFCREAISCLIARFRNNLATYHILFLDAKSGKHLTVDIDVPEFAQLRLRLFPNSFLLLAGIENNKNLVLRLYDVSAFLKSLKCQSVGDPSLTPVTLGNPGAKYSILPTPDHYELSSGYNNTVAVLNFCDSPMNSFMQVHIPSDDISKFSLQRDLKMSPFRRVANATPEHISLGKCGRRAVWMERRLGWDDITRCILMKGYFPTDLSGPVAVGPLLPSHMAFPFEVDTCQSLVLDEARGRVYLGLYTGEIYILDL